jgi:peptidoglycan/xylan/chitin deacetylase (PgdA/CDA1 family)
MRFLSIVIAILVSLDIAAWKVVFAQEAAATSYSSAANSISSSAPIAACDKPGGMGLSRVVEIDTTGGSAFGFGYFKQYDFLRDKEVVLTFDDGPWPENTAAVLKALDDNCLKATFFEIGKHAMWHPEITRQVIEAGDTLGTHTWSHKHLARKPYASDLEKAKQEIELGNSAVRIAAGTPVSPFFRFPYLQYSPRLLPTSVNVTSRLFRPTSILSIIGCISQSK